MSPRAIGEPLKATTEREGKRTITFSPSGYRGQPQIFFRNTIFHETCGDLVFGPPESSANFGVVLAQPRSITV